MVPVLVPPVSLYSLKIGEEYLAGKPLTRADLAIAAAIWVSLLYDRLVD